MTDNIYTDAAQHDAVIAARATITAPGVVLVNRERLAQLEAIESAAKSAFETLELCYETRQPISRTEAGLIAYKVLRKALEVHTHE